MKFEEMMNRLNEIVDALESEELNLDKSIKLYEEGLKLSKEIKDELSKFEEKISKLNKENEDEQ